MHSPSASRGGVASQVTITDARLRWSTRRLRKQVEAKAAYGIPETDISMVIGIDPKALRKCSLGELDLGETNANA